MVVKTNKVNEVLITSVVFPNSIHPKQPTTEVLNKLQKYSEDIRYKQLIIVNPESPLHGKLSIVEPHVLVMENEHEVVTTKNYKHRNK